ncbi:MAG TPA: hypothetical protein VFR44_12125 [Actinomycetota bacterium]|nr:hypothetical protein [Actinomycetota bacterium]
MDPDDGFERLLRGETPESPDERMLDLFLQDVRGAFPAEPPRAREAHLDGIVRAARLLADKGEPVARPASNADGRVPHASGLPKRRRMTVKVRVLRSMTAKVIAGLVVLMSMFGGLAFAGALPGTGDSGDDGTEVVVPQDVVTDDQGDDVAEAPEADDVEDEAEEPADDEGSEDSESDDQGEDADDQGEDADDQGEDADDQGEDESESEDDSQDESEDESEDDSQDESESESEDDSQDESVDGGDQGEDD